MSLKPDYNEESYRSIIISSFSSAGFWSVILSVTGVIAIVFGGAVNLAFEDLADVSLWVLLAGALSVFVSIILSPRAIAIFLVGRRGRYGTNVAIMTIAFFIIMLVINYFLYQNPNRIDVTATRIFSLSSQTLKILDTLPSDVTANAFFAITSSENTRQQTDDLLNEFARRSDKFSYRFIDPELDRAQAIRYNVTNFPTVVFEENTTGKLQHVAEFTEQEFVTGILISTGVEQKKIYYLTGHGEASYTRDPMLQEVEDSGLDYAIEGMERDNYWVESLNLIQSGSIPDDTAVLVIAGPKKDLSDDEFAAINEYVINGGRMLALFDPGVGENFNLLLVQFGFTISQKRIADAVSNVAGQMLTPMLQKANGQFSTSNQIGVGIADQVAVSFFPEAAAVIQMADPADMPPHIQFDTFGITTPVSWLEDDPENPEYSTGEMMGPFAIAGIIEASGHIAESPAVAAGRVPSRTVVVGDSDFATNKYFNSSDNADLFLNSVNWLADDYELISIRPKLIAYRELVVNTREKDFIKWSSWVFPPTLMIILGVFVWWRRR